MGEVKYIFVSGGVCSSLGKGIAASSIGTLLESRGFKVQMVKVDPYLNIDAGTMSPFQHGEVYVTDDGAETDLDLGNYERFTQCTISKWNSVTTGQVYREVIERERKGDYLGKCVQVIPHITDEIKRRIKLLAKHVDVVITEIGGTVGDIESVPFLEAARQFITDMGRENVVFVHLTLIPSLSAAGELKTKPTQHSVQKLMEYGIQPDILLCRMHQEMPADMRKKLSLFTNVPEDSIIPAKNIKDSIYEIPVEYEKMGLTAALMKKLKVEYKEGMLEKWNRLIHVIKNPQTEVKIAVIGKYIKLQDSYKSIYEALNHAAYYNHARLTVIKLDSEDLNDEMMEEKLEGADGILIPGGFGERGVCGKIAAAKYARENKLPYFGICLGMQIMVIEFARNVLGFEGANSKEFDPETEYPVIALLEEQEYIDAKGGTMRLGAYEGKITPETRLYTSYRCSKLSERHRHRYEFNNKYRKDFEENNLVISCTTLEGHLVEAVEWSEHPFGVGVQFHPEFKSNPFEAHPIFRDFIHAAINNHK